MFPVDCLLTAVLDSNAHGHGTFRIRVSIWDLSSRRVWGCFFRVADTCQRDFLSGGGSWGVDTGIGSESTAVLALAVHYKLPPS